MEITIVLAKFWGWFLVIENLLYLINYKVFVQRLRDKGFIAVEAYVSFILGLGTLVLYNKWTVDWQVIITIVGWIFLIRGAIRIGFPEMTFQKVSALTHNAVILKFMLIVMSIVGAVLLWVTL